MEEKKKINELDKNLKDHNKVIINENIKREEQNNIFE